MPVGDERTPPKGRRTRQISGQHEQDYLPQTNIPPERALVTRQTDGYDTGYTEMPPRPKTSTVRVNGNTTSSMPRVTQQPAGTPVPPRRQGQRVPPKELPPPRGRVPLESASAPRPGMLQRLRHMHWLFLIGLGMIVTLILWMLGTSILAWGTQRYNDFKYGSPRTYQTDAMVGHNDSQLKKSHFIAMNWNGQAIVLEFRGGTPTDSLSYIAPVYIAGDNGETPVTVDFKDVNNDNNLDMIIRMQGKAVGLFINDPKSKKFRPKTANDQINLEDL